MKNYKILFYLIVILSVNLFSQENITFSEIMFSPDESNSEFIELYNFGDTEIDLSSFAIQYQTSNYDSLTNPENNYILKPKSYVVILEGDYDLENGIYSDLIPDSTLVLYINDNSFGTSGMANSSDRSLFLINSSSDTINTYTYSADNSKGFSDEKIIPEEPNNETNWSNSNQINGTPGFKNSVSPLSFDLEISTSISQTDLVEGDSATVFAKVKNIGEENSSQFTLNFYDNKNLDSLINSSDLINSQNINSVVSGDSTLVQLKLTDLELRGYQIIAEIIFDEDEDTFNNVSFEEFTVSPKPLDPNDIVINEIMYKPQDDEPEWIEIYNTTTKEIDLSNYRIYDNTSSTEIPSFVLQPNSYLVLSDDSSIANYYEYEITYVELSVPSLNNSGDIIVLRDQLENTIDSVKYFPEWGGNENSLERIDAEEESSNSSNWSSAEFVRGTPSRVNSVTKKEYDLALTNISLTKDFAILTKPFEVEIAIKNLGNEIAQNSNLKIFLDKNKDSLFTSDELIQQIQIQPLLSDDSTVVNLTLDEFYKGENFLKAEIDFQSDQFDYNNRETFSFQGVEINLSRNDLAINEIMSAPDSEEPEWIEIVNIADEVKNLNGLTIADANSDAKIIGNDFSLLPNEFLVIANDSSFFQKHNIDSKIIIKSFPSLNNSGDKVILLDSLNRVIDSLEYKSTWELENGKSLERIDIYKASTDSLNWKSAVNEIGSTPGYINSVAIKNFDLAVNKIFIEPKFPLENENVNASVLIKNIGRNSAQFSAKLFIDENLDSLEDNLIENIENLNLVKNDSLVVSFNQPYKMQNREVQFIVKAEYPNDEDKTNNKSYKKIAPSYEPYSIVINEIMNYPQTGDVEWFELYNRTNEQINLKNWTVSDLLANPTKQLITEESFFIKQNDFLLIAKDSSIFNQYNLDESKVIVSPFANLNNDEDGIIIKDRFGKTIDSIHFKNSWGITKGYSLERKDVNYLQNDSTNWEVSKSYEQSSPLRVNSVSEKDIDLIISTIESIPKNPLKDETIKLGITIKNLGIKKSNSGSVNLQIENPNQISYNLSFDGISGKDSITITSESFPISDSVSIYAKIITTNEGDSTNNKFSKTFYSGSGEHSIIISEIMFEPKTDEPEWFEIFNTTDNPINLKNWEISDLSSSKIINNDFSINPKEYVVVTSDTNFAQSVKRLITKIPSLGNTEDAVILKDFRGKKIDSVYFYGDWNYSKGFSIERVEFGNYYSDSSNWISSVDPKGYTAGYQNSIENFYETEFNSIVINEIMFEPSSDNSEFIEIYNNSDESINLGGWEIIDENGNKTKVIPFSKELASRSYFTVAADSGFLNYYSTTSYFINENDGLSLSNSSEKLLLKDLFGNIIDSVTYNSAFHNFSVKDTKNKSLERINPNISSNDRFNWSTSVNPIGATPSKQNSIFVENSTAESKIEISPNPFSPDNDGFEDFSVIAYNLKSEVAQLRIRVFDSKGRLVRTILNNQSTGRSGSFIFDGLSDSGKPLKIGIYILFIEALDSFSGTIEVFKEPIVVARKL